MADLVTSLNIKQTNGEYAKQEIGVEVQNIMGLDKLLDITTEDNETSTHDYDEGDQFLWKGKLYEAVIPIGIGEAFVIDSDNANIKIANKVGDVFEGASADNKGSKGLVPAPNKGDQDKFLNARGFWSEVPGGTFLGTIEEWNELPQEEKNKYIKSKGGLVSLYNKGVYSYDGNELTPIVEKTELKNFQGVSSDEKGERGLVPAPENEDGDKVLQGNGTWGKKLQMDIVMQDNEYGYINAEGTFVPFKSQSDIQAAVADAIKATKVGTAAAEDVLAGRTFTNSNGVGIAGKMFNNGAVAPSGLNCGGTYTIPAGYHNGSGKVVANSLAAQTSANAGAGQILATKTAWVNGSKITGSMADKGAWGTTLNPGGSVTVPAGYHNGKGVIKANANQNKDKYVFPVNDVGKERDLGANNTIRYVSAENVYKKGQADVSPKGVLHCDYYFGGVDGGKGRLMIKSCSNDKILDDGFSGLVQLVIDSTIW